MISFGIAAAQAARLPITDIWWNVPAAVAYQLAFAYWQSQGSSFLIDNRAKIRAALCPRT
jgi:hypothetical protein